MVNAYVEIPQESLKGNYLSLVDSIKNLKSEKKSALEISNKMTDLLNDLSHNLKLKIISSQFDEKDDYWNNFIKHYISLGLSQKAFLSVIENRTFSDPNLMEEYSSSLGDREIKLKKVGFNGTDIVYKFTFFDNLLSERTNYANFNVN
ncbi:MAG: hypothetical protein WC307_02515 [Candidatus Nanoarchaeia archaeon]|jgi:hypothetical protein